MAIFDALQHLMVGQYIPADSPIHRRDPRARIIAFFMLITAVTLTTSLFGLCAAVIASALLLKLSKMPFKHAVAKLRVPLPMIILLALLQLFITPSGSADNIFFSYGVVTISGDGLRASALLIARFVSLVWLFSAAGAVISSIDMIYGIDLIFKPLQKLGLPAYNFTMTIQMMLRFIPYLIFNAEKIARAQASRGARWDDPHGGIFQRAKGVLPLIIPLFSNSLKQADALARAMVARAYGASRQRTGLREYHMNAGDIIFLVLCLAAAVLFFLFPR